MKLYHGTTVEIREPQIIEREKGRDFGPAFYTTPIKAQAERWAKRKALIEYRFGDIGAKPIVNVYEFDEEKTEKLNVLYLENASEQWLDLVITCRSDASFRHGYDIVKGKTADDSVGETVSFVMQKIMRKEDALNKLQFQKVNSQIAFCTEESLKAIKFKYSYEVNNG